MKVLLAPDKFKGSLSAEAVAAHLAAGLRRAHPEVETDALPVADGGEGTVAAALAAGFEAVELEATGPLGEPVATRYARRGDVAVIEMAAVTGLEMVTPDRRTAREATSRGLGELIAHALDGGAGRLVVGVGGSASTDGGAGMLAALGVRLSGQEGTLPDGGAALSGLAGVDLSGLHSRLGDAELLLASDVDNPLLGPMGAAAIFGPQKGADAEVLAELEEAMGRWVERLAAEPLPRARELASAPGAGAAGGVGFGLLLLGAERRPGIEVVLDLAGFDERVREAALVITGEGSLDEQSLAGKVPVGVARAAAAWGVPAIAVCGRTTLEPGQAQEAGLQAVHALTHIEPDPARCMVEAGPLLEELAGRIALPA